MTVELTEQEAEQLLKKLDELEAKIDDIQRNVQVMIQIHEMLHPEELENARERVENSPR